MGKAVKKTGLNKPFLDIEAREKASRKREPPKRLWLYQLVILLDESVELLVCDWSIARHQDIVAYNQKTLNENVIEYSRTE